MAYELLVFMQGSTSVPQTTCLTACVLLIMLLILLYNMYWNLYFSVWSQFIYLLR